MLVQITHPSDAFVPHVSSLRPKTKVTAVHSRRFTHECTPCMIVLIIDNTHTWYISCKQVTACRNWVGTAVKVQFRGPKLFKKKGGTISRRIVPTWYRYALMNKLVIRLWMDGLNLNVILMLLPKWFCHTAAIASAWQTALPARGCHALRRVIVRELSCTCIVTSWSQRRRPKHDGLATRWGSTCHAYGRKSAIKIQC